jgi:hypothetical protein
MGANTQMISPKLHRVERASLASDAANPETLMKIGESCAFSHPSSERPGDDRTYKFPTSESDLRRHAERVTSYFMICFRPGGERSLLD